MFVLLLLLILVPCSIELLMFYCKMYSMFYGNDEPEGKFVYTETIKLYCVVLYCTGIKLQLQLENLIVQ